MSSVSPPSALEDEVTEGDEVYINAGEKGRRPADPADPPRRRANKRRGHGTWDNARPPVAGVVGRQSGQIRLRVLEHSSKAELRSLGEAASAAESTFNTDEWQGYSWVGARGRVHKTVCHAPGVREWARDDDGAGVREVHVNTIEGLWAALRTLLRPFRGVNKEYLAQYLAVFGWMHNIKRATIEFVRLMLIPCTPDPT